MAPAQTRGSGIDLLTGRSQARQPASDSEWAEVKYRIEHGRVIPIISSSLRYDGIFDKLLEYYYQSLAQQDCAPQPVKIWAENLLAQSWAQKIGYPLPDQMELPRVAQFHSSTTLDIEELHRAYLRFLKDSLLGYAENLGADTGLIDEQIAQIDKTSFADIAQNLGYPLSISQDNDPLRILARQPLPMYVTTDYHDFVERALILEGKKPVTQLSKWAGEIDLAKEHIPDPDYEPNAEFPLVYHVFGLEEYPKSIVLSEDDYLSFLVKVSREDDAKSEHAVIPYSVRSALSSAFVILLGYRLQDWDFRVLFRSLLNRSNDPARSVGMIIQLTPDQQYNIQNPQEAQEYLKKYFELKKFSVAWGGVDAFLKRLMEK